VAGGVASAFSTTGADFGVGAGTGWRAGGEAAIFGGGVTAVNRSGAGVDAGVATGRGGACPVTVVLNAISVLGASTIFSAEIVIPFRNSCTEAFSPLTTKRYDSATLYVLFSLLGSVMITVLPDTNQTFPDPMVAVLSVTGVVVVVTVAVSLVPGCSS
jgi:hypothetical protein